MKKILICMAVLAAMMPATAPSYAATYDLQNYEVGTTRASGKKHSSYKKGCARSTGNRYN